MFAADTAGQEIFTGLAYTVGAGFIFAVARAGMHFYEKRQTATMDNASLTDFFFDSPPNPRTRTPARKGWTSKVDETLELLVTGQATLTTEVSAMRKEAGEAIRLARLEVAKQVTERERVQQRDRSN